MTDEIDYYDSSKICGKNGRIKTFCGKKKQLKGIPDEPLPTSIKDRHYVGGFKEGSCKNCCYKCKQVG